MKDEQAMTAEEIAKKYFCYSSNMLLAMQEYAEQQSKKAFDINFIKWYSGMSEEKIRRAYEQYRNENPIN